MGAPPGNNFNPMGRPRKEIDWDQFEQLCALQCTQPEIAGLLKIDEDTLRSRVKDKYEDEYSVVYKKFSDSGKCSLRRNQFVLSKTNAAMAIWLGKQWLGQKDHEEKNNSNITLQDLIEFVSEIKKQPGTELPS